MAKEYTVSLREAVSLLDKKPATIRSYVRSGRLSKQYVDGFNGQEMRLNKEEILELKKSLTESVTNPNTRVSDTVKKEPVKQHGATESHAPSDGNVTRAIELLEKELQELRKEKESLRTESKELSEKNFQMAGQLGYFQNQVETLKDQVKQLSAPEESKSSKKQSKSTFWSFLTNKR